MRVFGPAAPDAARVAGEGIAVRADQQVSYTTGESPSAAHAIKTIDALPWRKRQSPSKGVQGSMSARQALSRLRAGTGVNFQFTDQNTVALQWAAEGTVTPAVAP